MQIPVRLSGDLSRYVGASRMVVHLDESATVQDLVLRLGALYPPLADRLERAIPVIAGRHASPTDALEDGQEVAFIVPVGGGAPAFLGA